MKKIFQLLACALMIFTATSCSQGAAAIDKAYEQASKAEPVEKIATTLCNGDIKCSTLTTEEAAKLGAVLGYITFHGMYSSNFEAQVDMHQFGDLLQGYRNLETHMTGTDRALVEEYTRGLLINAPEGIPGPPPGPAPEGPAPECPADTCDAPANAPAE